MRTISCFGGEALTKGRKRSFCEKKLREKLTERGTVSQE